MTCINQVSCQMLHHFYFQMQGGNKDGIGPPARTLDKIQGTVSLFQDAEHQQTAQDWGPSEEGSKEGELQDGLDFLPGGNFLNIDIEWERIKQKLVRNTSEMWRH